MKQLSLSITFAIFFKAWNVLQEIKMIDDIEAEFSISALNFFSEIIYMSEFQNICLINVEMTSALYDGLISKLFVNSKEMNKKCYK